jgi:hypothetical protein
MWDRCCPGLEFLEGLGLTGAIALGHPVEAHGAPLVMVTFQPDLEEILELPVLGDVAR